MIDWKKLGQLGPEAPQDPFAGMDPMVVEHIKKKMGGVDAAQKQADNTQTAGVVAGVADKLANAFNQPVALGNRMQDLGKAPSMLEGRQQNTDMSGLQRSAQHGLDMANSDRDQALQQMLAERKSQLAAQVAAKRQGIEDTFKQAQLDQQGNTLKETSRHNKAMEGLDKDKVGKEKSAAKAANVDLAVKIGENYSKDKIVSDAVQTRKRADEVAALAKNANGASDEALIVAYQKALDPGSSVMTGEFSRTEDGQAAVQRAQMYVQKLQSGQRLSPEMRADIVKVANQLAANADRYHQAVKSRYASQAKAAEIDPSLVFPGDVAPASGGMVRVADPQGIIRNIPAEHLDAALKAGGKRVD